MPWKKYYKKHLTEMRPVTREDITDLTEQYLKCRTGNPPTISISREDIENGSPKLGDMIARDSANHNDQWLISEKYFKENYESK